MTPLFFALLSRRSLPIVAVAPAVEYAIEGVLVVTILWVGWRLRRTLGTRTRELRDSKERFRELFEHGIEGVYESGPAGGFKSVNPAMARLLGYARPDELTKLKPEETARLYVSGTRREEFFRALGAGDHVSNFESEVRRPDGTVVWVSENVHAVRDPQGRLLRLQGFVSDITARKQAELELRASEVRYRLLFENSPVGIVELNSLETTARFDRLRAEGVTDLAAWMTAQPEAAEELMLHLPIAGMNATALRLVGASNAEEVRRGFGRIFGREALELRRRALLEFWSGAHDVEGETNLTSLDGTTRRVYARWWMPEVVGRPRGERTQLALVDLTATRQAEAAQQQSETRSRAVFEHSPVPLVEFGYHGIKEHFALLRAQGVVDLDAHFAAHPEALAAALEKSHLTAFNGAMVQLLGARSKEEVVANLDRVFTREVLGVRRSNLLALWRGECRNEGEITLTTLDGRQRRVVHRWWMPEVAGEPGYQWAQSALIDITDIRATEAALIAERTRLAVTLSAMTEGVITTDPAGVVQFMNEAAGVLVGWEPAAAVGRPIDEICRLSDAKSQRPVLAPVASALAHAAPVDLPPQTELQAREGARRRVEGRCAPMHDPSGHGLGAVFVLRDVTEKARFETEMLRASKLESVGLLAGGIAHDFNNLLAIVMGNLTLALLDEKTAASGGRWLREAERGTARARELTQQLLTFAKGGEPVRSAVLLSDLVREAAEFALHGATVRCEFDLADDVRPADADKGQIGQVVQNLVINAMQAMPAGGVIRLSLRNESLPANAVPPLPAGDYLRLEIADTGHGIAPNHLSRMFEPFFTTKEHGTGLGLATVYSIVQKHRGHVSVESEFGRGTTFRVWLPAARTVPTPTVATNSPFERLSGRVLFMDDEEPIRVMTRSLLERLGLEVVVTGDGEEAVKQFARARANGQPFDAVIVDLTVPGGMGGAAAMSEILKLDPDARGIVSSGYSSDPIMADFRAHGFRGSVPKPYKVSDFARTLRAVLQEE